MKKLINQALIAFFCISLMAFADENISDVTTTLEAKNAKVYKQHIVAGQPSWNDLLKLKQAGIKQIINLRAEGEFNQFNEAQAAEALGLEYVHIPVAGAKGVDFEHAEKLHLALVKNIQPSFIHCASGNRVGALTALNAFTHHNMSVEQAIAEGNKAGMTRLKLKVTELLKSK